MTSPLEELVALLDIAPTSDTVFVGQLAASAATSRMWMRADGELPDDPVVHTAVLVYSSDLTVLDPVTRPHALSMVASDVLPATIDHALWIHGSIRADEWWLCDADSTWAGDGRGFVRGRVFDRAGTLVAQIALEGLIRLPPTGERGR